MSICGKMFIHFIQTYLPTVKTKEISLDWFLLEALGGKHSLEHRSELHLYQEGLKQRYFLNNEVL